MSTPIGGTQLNWTQSSNANQNDIDTFLKNLGIDQKSGIAKVDPKGAGKDVVTTDKGEKFFSFDDNFSKGKIAVKGDQDAVIGTGKNTKVIGGGGENKILVTDDANHKIITKGGDDEVVLAGGGGHKVNLGKGNDTVHSSSGDDKLTGGKGSDTFVYGAGKEGKDVITDFKKADILKIADRNDDGQVDEGKDFTVGKDANGYTVIEFLGADGKPTGDQVTLKGVSVDHLKEGEDDGTFHI